MSPYHPPSGGRRSKVRLDFNENTVGCSPKVLRRLKKITAGELTVYPEYTEVLSQFAKHFHVSPSELTVTNGTDEAIQLVVNTFVGPGDTVVIPRPTYAMYRFYSQIAGARVIEIDYGSGLRFPATELIQAAKAGAKAILIANPNNPTGTSATKEKLKAILEASPHAAVLIDEAYFEFSGQTVLPWISRYPNLFVSRTFSKAFGLASLRLGCLFSQEDNMEKIRKGQSPYSVNTIAVLCGLEAIRDSAYIKRYVSETLRAREILCGELERLDWKYYPSDANFVLVDFGGDAGAVQRSLQSRNILVRDRSYEIANCLRITLGTVAQTRKLISALRQFRRKSGRTFPSPSAQASHASRMRRAAI
jgi:histidinol-phosphate aminotransferase